MPEPDSEPHEYVDAEFQIDGLEQAVTLQKVMATLDGVDGIKRAHASGDRLFVEYEPVRITRKKIEHAIVAAGFPIKEVASSSDSPLTDALHPEP